MKRPGARAPGVETAGDAARAAPASGAAKLCASAR
jgi:hypothetical protein